MTDRRAFLKKSAQATAYTFLFSQLYACKTKSKFLAPIGQDYNMQMLRDGVGYFTERGGTIGWMATKDGIVVVDTQAEYDAWFTKQQETKTFTQLAGLVTAEVITEAEVVDTTHTEVIVEHAVVVAH